MVDPKIKELRDEMARVSGNLARETRARMKAEAECDSAVAFTADQQERIQMQQNIIETQEKLIASLKGTAALRDDVIALQQKLVATSDEALALCKCLVTELDDEISELNAELENVRG